MVMPRLSYMYIDMNVMTSEDPMTAMIDAPNSDQTCLSNLPMKPLLPGKTRISAMTLRLDKLKL
jgi:hypothetical protein